MEHKFQFFCLQHPDEVIVRVDPVQNSDRDLYCTQCLFSSETPENLQKRLQKIDGFINEAGTLISQNKPKIYENLQTPKEVSGLLDQQAEMCSLISQKIETEKANAEKVFEWISSTVQEIISSKRKQYFELLDNQISNFAFQFSSLEKQIRKAYPTAEDAQVLFPTTSQLTERLHSIKDTAGLSTFLRGLKQDLFELKSGNREQIVHDSINTLTNKLNNAVKESPTFGAFDYQKEHTELENFINSYLGSSLQLVNPIQGPLSIVLSKGANTMNLKASFAEIDPSKLSVTVSSTVQGGGTGQEWPKNLLIPGNSGGNKWYTTNGGEQWIKVDLKGSKALKMYGLKSANDSEGRDPYSWKASGKTASGNWEVFHEVKEIKFNNRYEFRYFTVNPQNEYSEVQITFDRNRSTVEKGSWGDGLQLCEVSFFEEAKTN